MPRNYSSASAEKLSTDFKQLKVELIREYVTSPPGIRIRFDQTMHSFVRQLETVIVHPNVALRNYQPIQQALLAQHREFGHTMKMFRRQIRAACGLHEDIFRAQRPANPEESLVFEIIQAFMTVLEDMITQPESSESEDSIVASDSEESAISDN